MALPRQPYVSVEEYLELDRSNKEARYEYYDGQVVKLVGGSNYHSAIKINLAGILSRLVQGNLCRINGSDLRVQVSKKHYVHPDAAITCDRRDYTYEDVIRYPRVVFEILSPSTEARDRGEKFTLYRKCSSIQEYVMIDSLKVQIEVYHRNDEKWTLSIYRRGDEVRLESLNIQFPVEAVYEGLDFSLASLE